MLNAVTLELIAPSEVTATVRDPEPLPVRIAVEGDQLVGTCPCEIAAERICRHPVAIAHAVWARDRRQFGRLEFQLRGNYRQFVAAGLGFDSRAPRIRFTSSGGSPVVASLRRAPSRR